MMPAAPKPAKGTAKREKAASKRAQAKADKLVYAAVDARDGYRCRLCGEYCGVDIHRHHIVYRSQGGATTTANVISLCADCHLNKVHGGRIRLRGDANGRDKYNRLTIRTARAFDGDANCALPFRKGGPLIEGIAAPKLVVCVYHEPAEDDIEGAAV